MSVVLMTRALPPGHRGCCCQCGRKLRRVGWISSTAHQTFRCRGCAVRRALALGRTWGWVAARLGPAAALAMAERMGGP